MTGDATEESNEAAPRPIGRAAYLAAVVPLLVVQYVIVIGLRWYAYGTGLNDWSFEQVAIPVGIVILGCTVVIGWLSSRRAATVGASPERAAAAIVPWIQLVAVPLLAFAPENPKRSPERSLIAVRAALWGLSIALAAEIVLTLMLGQFGLALFVGSPFLVGMVAAYIAERDGHSSPLLLGQTALVLASAVLFGFAFEGLICLIMAYPLAMLATLIGGYVGMGLGRLNAARPTLVSSVALLPLMVTAELSAPPLASFADRQSVEVSAPPAAVWDSIVHMGKIDHPPGGPFGWGLAYPVAGHIDGSGIGAVRRGVFSTGVAYERVTRWEPNRELWFDVLTDPPMMRETNPFGPVRSAHLDGYFVTRTAHFTIEPTTPGHTRLTLATEHQLRIGPTTYFLPIARWAVDENKRRVLDHFRDRAEAAVRARQ